MIDRGCRTAEAPYRMQVGSRSGLTTSAAIQTEERSPGERGAANSQGCLPHNFTDMARIRGRVSYRSRRTHSAWLPPRPPTRRRRCSPERLLPVAPSAEGPDRAKRENHHADYQRDLEYHHPHGHHQACDRQQDATSEDDEQYG